MRANAGYIITQTIRIGDVEIVLGESGHDPARYVTWECSDGDNYYWGHYITDELAALRDLLTRAADKLDMLERIRKSQTEED